MVPSRRQKILFVVGACLLLAVGYGLGYAKAFAHYYGLTMIMDRETLDLEFNSRMLHYADTSQVALLRAKLFRRLSEEVQYVDEVIASSKHKNLEPDVAQVLRHARAVLSPQRNWGSLAANAAAPVVTPHPEPAANHAPEKSPPPAVAR